MLRRLQPSPARARPTRPSEAGSGTAAVSDTLSMLYDRSELNWPRKLIRVVAAFAVNETLEDRKFKRPFSCP